jgi:streptogramin lyase
MQALPLSSSLNESIYFDYAPPPTFAGHINRHPFRVVITSSNTNTHVIDLKSKYSKSYLPQNQKSKWSFLRPHNNFLNLSGNKISNIVTNDTSLYVDGNNVLNTVSGNFVGVSGYAEFYFVDDIYNYDLAFNDKQYTTIVAVLQTSGVNFFTSDSPHIQSSRYSTSQAIAYQPHVFHYRDPDYIKITENGIRDFINPRWVPVDQHAVFTFNWNKQYSELYYDGNEINPLGFNKSLPSNTNTDTISITAQLINSTAMDNLTSYNIVKAYFPNSGINVTYHNIDGYLSPGYCKTIFNVGKGSTLNYVMTAESTFNSPNTQGNMYSPKMWLSNPNAGLMSLVEYNFPKNYNLNSKLLQKAQIYNFIIPTSALEFHNITDIAVLPSPDFQAWAIDNKLGYLYKFGTNGKILTSINIKSLLNNNTVLSSYNFNTPLKQSSLVLDGQKNIWIALNNFPLILNFDQNVNYIYSLNLTQNNQNYDLSNPITIDIDHINNIWTSFSNYTSGCLLKFDANNNPLTAVNYPIGKYPQNIIIDNQYNIWISLSGNFQYNIIEKRDTNSGLLSTINTQFTGVNHFALDLNQNLWFSYGYSNIGYIDNITSSISSFNILDNSDNLFQYYPSINADNTLIEGLACDLKGYLYVVNSVENQIYIYNTNTKTYVDKFYVNPQGFITYGNPSKLGYNKWEKSLKAGGDWMGTRWLNKYNNQLSNYQISISGNSGELNFSMIPSKNLISQYSFLANTFYKYIETNNYEQILVTVKPDPEPILSYFNYDIFKINENYDLGAQLKSFALTPTLFESTYLFNNFLPSIYGVYPYSHQDLGISSYEKITNFVINNSDIDTCEIDKLYSISQATNTDTDDYMLNYPLDLKKLMDLLSINQSRLWGSTQMNQNNFNQSSNNGEFNVGAILSPDYIVIAGTPILLKTKSLSNYELIQTGVLNGLEQYSLNNLAYSIGIIKNSNDSWQNYYEFYEYIPVNNTVYSDNIIDWNNPQTTITPNLTSIFDWIGDEKTIDKIFSYHLYKGLGIF